MGRCKILGLLKLFLWYVPWISRASLPPSWVSLRVHHCEWLLWLKAWWPQHRLFTEIQVIFFVPCFFCDPTHVGNLISGSSAFSKSSWYIWKFSVHVLPKSAFEGFWTWRCWHVKWAQLYDDLNILCHCLFWDWNEDWPFLVVWPRLSFPNLLAYWVQHFHNIIFQDFSKLKKKK